MTFSVEINVIHSVLSLSHHIDLLRLYFTKGHQMTESVSKSVRQKCRKCFCKASRGLFTLVRAALIIIYLSGSVRGILVFSIVWGNFSSYPKLLAATLTGFFQSSRTSSGRTFTKPNQNLGRKQNFSFGGLKVKQ